MHHQAETLFLLVVGAGVDEGGVEAFGSWRSATGMMMMGVGAEGAVPDTPGWEEEPAGEETLLGAPVGGEGLGQPGAEETPSAAETTSSAVETLNGGVEALSGGVELLATGGEGTAAEALTSARFLYDGDGTLMKATVNTRVTYYPTRQYNKEVNGATTTVKKFYFVGAQTIAVRTVVGASDTLNWVLGDHLGSATVTANTDGAKSSELKYTAFGEIRASSGSSPTEYRYTGQLRQAELGLYTYVARWYDPTIAHFAQADSIVPGVGEAKAFDRYAYGLNNPSRYTDPTGHWFLETNKPEEEQRRNAYIHLAQKSDSLNGFQQEYYAVAAAYYHAQAIESSAENIEALGSILQNKADQAAVNGWNGANVALDTAFRTSGMDVSQAIMAGGIGLYGALKATNGLGLFDLLPDSVSFTTDEVLTLGQNFVGDNPLTVAEGVYVSSTPVGTINGREVYAQFRITDRDITGHGLSPQANFEIVNKVKDLYGRVSYQRVSGVAPTHVYFSDLP